MEDHSIDEAYRMAESWLKLALFIPLLISFAMIPVVGSWALIPISVLVTCIEIVHHLSQDNADHE